MSVDPKEVMDKIDVDELIKVTLDLANIDSPTGEEGPVADYVQDWLVREGFDAWKVALYPDRPNVLATLPGAGNGGSLCFNSHMDTTVHKDEWWATRHAADPIFHTGWREGDVLVGNGVCNCKGPMALAACRRGHQGFGRRAQGRFVADGGGRRNRHRARR